MEIIWKREIDFENVTAEKKLAHFGPASFPTSESVKIKLYDITPLYNGS